MIIPAYNEEKNIGECLESVSWAGEIIVVDGGSTDGTREIARRFTENILVTENAPAETQRLKALGRIKHPWFFLLDADERVTEGLREQIEKVVVSSDDKSAYLVLRENVYHGRAVHLHRPDYQLRLFKWEEASSLPERIHRLPQVKGKTGRLNGRLVHHFFPSVQDYLRKLNRYTDTEVRYWTESGRLLQGPAAFYYLAIRPAGRFCQYYFLRKGFLDGFFGFFYSFSSAFYDLMVAARVILEGRR